MNLWLAERYETRLLIFLKDKYRVAWVRKVTLFGTGGIRSPNPFSTVLSLRGCSKILMTLVRHQRTRLWKLVSRIQHKAESRFELAILSQVLHHDLGKVST
jgi:hypothetical protein